MIAHWDEAESGRAEAGHIAGEWTDLGVAAGKRWVIRCGNARLDDLDYDDGEPG